MNTLLIFAMAIVLHNSLDKDSRVFVDTIPKDADVQVIDWYQDDVARFGYMGPPPSAFPTVILTTDKGLQGSLRAPTDWTKDIAPLLKDQTDAKFEAVIVPGTYLGGQTIPEMTKLKDNKDVPLFIRSKVVEKLPEAQAKAEQVKAAQPIIEDAIIP